MSDTPKTDEVAFTRFNDYAQHDEELVHADFARAQERRIAELESANATLERSNKRLREKCDRLADTAMARGDR